MSDFQFILKVQNKVQHSPDLTYENVNGKANQSLYTSLVNFASEPESGFTFTCKVGQHQIHSINGVANDTANNTYWNLYQGKSNDLENPGNDVLS
ncbi:hypothetical protein HOLleu_10494 [Holothuria leucospilota]|uniref:Uncharacterized protein n=1 Tax=Holothuria leucospilota TaxID=206669 RepID=A0A9Q1CET7_HOLLE|nr:hypothetical protein HOLleu_10494 [Holothuria leucospilota]